MRAMPLTDAFSLEAYQACKDQLQASRPVRINPREDEIRAVGKAKAKKTGTKASAPVKG
jgi:hypothetical protein